MYSLWYAFQRLVAAIALIGLLPLFALIWIAVKATSRGPFLYSQQRPGIHGRPIRTWKIRTMLPGSDRNPQNARCVGQSNPDVTSVGRVLRTLKLDELPQLWNVVLGEMAFVGPRPIAVPLHNELCRKIPGFQRRTLVRPGLSTIGQVSIDENAEGNDLLADWKQRFEAEKHYLANRSAVYDMIVMLLTLLYLARKLRRLFVGRTIRETKAPQEIRLSPQSRTA